MSNKIRNWIAGIIGLGIMGVGALFTTNQLTSTSTEKASDVKPRIEIVTTDAKPLELKVKSNWVDFMYYGNASKGKLRNLLDSNCIRLNNELGFQGGGYTWGSICQYFHFAKEPLNAYGMQEMDFSSPTEFRTYGGGVNTVVWNADFSINSAAFAQALNVKCDVVLNPIHGTWQESRIAIERFASEYVGIGCESITNDNYTSTQYKATAQAWTDSIVKYFPNTKIVLDAPLIYRMNKRGIEWANMINTIKRSDGKPLFYRNYNQVGDRVAFTSNQDSNLLKVLQYYNEIVPKDLDSCKLVYLNMFYVSAEFMNEDSRGNTQYINNKTVGNYSLGRMYEMFIGKQDLIKAAYWMSLKNLISAGDSISNNYTTLKMLNTLLKAKNVTQVTFSNMEGVTGVSLNDGGTNYVLINNSSKNPYTLSKFIVDGTSTNSRMSFQVVSGSSVDWNSELKYQTISSTGTFTIPQCGVSVISFTKN